MEKIIGLFTLVVSTVYFYALVYYMLLEPESWKIIITKPYKGKQYRVVEGYLPMLTLLLSLSIIFPILGYLEILGPWENYHSFVWFVFSIGLVVCVWSIYVGIRADRGYYIVTVAIIIIHYLLLKGLLLADPTWCWIVSGTASLFAIYKRQKAKKIEI